MIFGYEFNSDAEMPEQMQLYFEQLDEEDGVPTEAEVTYRAYIAGNQPAGTYAGKVKYTIVSGKVVYKD